MHRTTKKHSSRHRELRGYVSYVNPYGIRPLLTTESRTNMRPALLMNEIMAGKPVSDQDIDDAFNWHHPPSNIAKDPLSTEIVEMPHHMKNAIMRNIRSVMNIPDERGKARIEALLCKEELTLEKSDPVFITPTKRCRDDDDDTDIEEDIDEAFIKRRKTIENKADVQTQELRSELEGFERDILTAVRSTDSDQMKKRAIDAAKRGMCILPLRYPYATDEEKKRCMRLSSYGVSFKL